MKFRRGSDIATDQLLNAIYLTLHGVNMEHEVRDKKMFKEIILQALENSDI
jgi:hypothetical protein